MLKVILFDFNGVIIKDESIHHELINEILIGENLRAVGLEFNDICLGRNDRTAFREVLALRGRSVTEDYLTGLIEKKARLYAEKMAASETLPIYEGITAFLKRIRHRELKIGLVTGALGSEVEIILERSGLKEYFSVIVTGEEVRAGKPEPDGYLLAVERFNRLDFNLQLQPGECLAIEDSLAGLTAAKRAGMQVVGIAHSYPFHFMQRFSNWAIDEFSQLDLDRVEREFARDRVLTE